MSSGKWLLVLAFVASVPFLGSCADSPTSPPVAVASVAVAPDSVALFSGDTVRFVAVLRDGVGNELTDRAVEWSSSNPSVASVDGTGLVQGRGSGFATIEARSGGESDLGAVRVLQVPASIGMSPDSITVVLGEAMQFNAMLVGEGGDVLPDSLMAWSSDDTAVAKVDAEGRVTPVGMGSATITASFAEIAGSARTTVATTTPVSGVSAWFAHACAVTTSGVAYCWGRNTHGQLGDGTETTSDAPVAVAGGLAFASITAGQNHTCGVTTTGDAYCWGSNVFGELGTIQPVGTCGASAVPCGTTPLLVDGGYDFATVAAGEDHVCGMTTGGEAYCWGSNERGQLGNPATTQTCNGPIPCSTVPIQVRGGLDFESVSAFGFGHSCGLATTGIAYCWGRNPGAASSTSPAQVAGGLTYESINAGYLHNCVLTDDGTAYCWGLGALGEFGNGTQGTDVTSDVPLRVSGGHVFSSISAGAFHNCAITTEGVAYCWGLARFGQLGSDSESRLCLGEYPCNTTPVPVTAGLAFESISAGNERTCGVTKLGSLYCWGGEVLEPTFIPIP